MTMNMHATALLATFATVAAASGQQPRESIDLIVHGEYVVTMDAAQPVIEDGAVAIDGGRIAAVGGRAAIESSYTARETIPGHDRVLMPGLVNGHTHAAMVLFRGLADDLPLMRWLQEYIFPMEARFVDAEFVRVGVRLACWEMIRGGTTTFVDMYFHPEVAAEVVDDCGLRAILAAPMIDFPSPGFTGWDDSFAAGVAFAEAWAGRSERVAPALGPHAAYTVSPEHLQQAWAAARRLGVPISVHLAEDASETATIRERHGTTPVRHFERLGLLDQPTIAAHVVWPDLSEMAILARSRAGAIHNPTSNLKTGAGISPVPDMLAAGVRVGLGTDGAASNNDLDMWEEIRLAALLHKGVRRETTVMPAHVVLCLATHCGAEAIDMGDEIGALVPGLRADLIQVSLASPRLAPLYDVVSHLVYVVDAQDVVTTIVSGRVLMRDGVVLTIDGDAAAADAARIADSIRAALDDGERE
ncbi:MAG TPA: amidohydrolase [Longimicrobiales bacterium]|nr:amidohydrolase [Longimicrobiales bacterium]